MEAVFVCVEEAVGQSAEVAQGGISGMKTVYLLITVKMVKVQKLMLLINGG